MGVYYIDAEGNPIDAEQARAMLAAHRTELANRRTERLDIAVRLTERMLETRAATEDMMSGGLDKRLLNVTRLAWLCAGDLLKRRDALIAAVDKKPEDE